MARQGGERAKKMENPTTRGPVEAMARRFGNLAVKLEVARKQPAAALGHVEEVEREERRDRRVGLKHYSFTMM